MTQAAETGAPAGTSGLTPDRNLALERASPHVHVTITGSVRNGLPDPGFLDAFPTDGFVVRALRSAAAG